MSTWLFRPRIIIFVDSHCIMSQRSDKKLVTTHLIDMFDDLIYVFENTKNAILILSED